MNHVADRDAFQRDGSAILEPGGILKVAAENQLAGKKTTARSGHEKDKHDQDGRSRQDKRSHPQFRPLNLFAAWHEAPLAEWMQ
jgi:hypothetical protein